MTEWNATLYDRQHDFVAEYGRGLLTFVPQQPKQAILDLGCGTGTLTAQLNSLGDDVKGTDRSPAMIAQARRSYPTIQFEVEDGLQMTDVNRWNVIFSNAVFHWIQDHPRLLRRIYQALRPGGQLICEFGAAGNIATIENGFREAIAAYGGTYHPKFNFATVARLTQQAQAAGLVVEKCYDFERPTPLKAGEQGLANWARQFFASELAFFSPVEQDEILARLAARVRDELWDGHQWVADYRRIRCVARKD